MAELSFKSASALVFDPVSDNRNATRNTLYSIGFREIDAVGDLQSVRSDLSVRSYDLVVLEMAGGVTGTCGLIRSVRTGQEGVNPFAIMVLTAWDLSKSVVTAALDSGADDLIARPFSIGQFNRRLKMLVEARKQFVVTSDYVGPDRRKDPSRGGAAELIDVPNTLRGKVVDNATSEDFDGAIFAMRQKMDGERLRRLGAQIAVSAEIVMDWALSPEGLFDAGEIDRLRRAAQELQARENEGAAAGTGDLCAGVLKVCDALVGGDCDAEKEANLLKELANGIQLALNPERSPGDLAGEIASTVAGLKSRKAQNAAS